MNANKVWAKVRVSRLLLDMDAEISIFLDLIPAGLPNFSFQDENQEGRRCECKYL